MKTISRSTTVLFAAALALTVTLTGCVSDEPESTPDDISTGSGDTPAEVLSEEPSDAPDDDLTEGTADWGPGAAELCPAGVVDDFNTFVEGIGGPPQTEPITQVPAASALPSAIQPLLGDTCVMTSPSTPELQAYAALSPAGTTTVDDIVDAVTAAGYAETEQGYRLNAGGTSTLVKPSTVAELRANNAANGLDPFYLDPFDEDDIWVLIVIDPA